MAKKFQKKDLLNLWLPNPDSQGEDNGQITIIGGSRLFHGAPFFSLLAASRVVDMVFFSSPEPIIEKLAVNLKSKLFSFIWVPWDEVEHYIKKSDSILIGPGFMRYSSEKKKIRGLDQEGLKTHQITKYFLKKYKHKKWVVDAGSLQVIKPDVLPKGCIITPNKKEFLDLFNLEKIGNTEKTVEKLAKKHSITISFKAPVSVVSDGEETVLVGNGNPGLTKGGTGDTLAGLTTAFFAKNSPLLSASCASFVVKKTAEFLEEKVGIYFNADDLAGNIFEALQRLKFN